jgi:hypothetical protein
MGFYKFGPTEGEVRQKTTKPIDVTIAMFFDGTGNNKDNTDERLKQSSIYREKTGQNSSYENDYSNVARLFQNYQDKKGSYTFGHYVEGMGTKKDQKDDNTGTGLGSGDTGIATRVKESCKWIADKLSDLLHSQNPKIVNRLTIDVFGFSRGAATARLFLYEIKRNGYTAKKIYIHQGYILVDDMKQQTDFSEFPKGGYLGAYCKMNTVQINTIIIRFAGLFDCVASYSDGLFIPESLSNKKNPTDNTPEEFKDDTKELHLDAIGYLASRVIHFTAADEHRGNFPLTTINSAGSKGTSYSFPGVHSDVGGCYQDNMKEINNAIISGENDKLLKEKQRLIEEGWFKKDELYIDNIILNNLYGERIVRNTYSFIPLHLMCKLAIDFTTKDSPNNPLQFNQKNNIEDQFSIKKEGALLERVKSKLTDYVFNNGEQITLSSDHPIKINDASEKQYDSDASYVKTQSPVKSLSHLSQDDQDLLKLRHGYLHWNANYDASYGYLHPMYPRLINGVRQRLILPG